MRPILEIIRSISSGAISSPCVAPAARVMDSFIKVIEKTGAKLTTTVQFDDRQFVFVNELAAIE